jgi:hypothetical protein
MNFNNINHLKDSGFVGFYSYNHLVSDYSLINPFKGVYLVINFDYKNPEFTDPGVCGTHKGKNPNRTIEHLKEKYVNGSQIMYIGKGGKLAKDSKANLQTRLKDYLKCSINNTCSHSGGRSIWQLQNFEHLIFCWKKVEFEEPENYEAILLQMFINQFGKLPFANYKL